MHWAVGPPTEQYEKRCPAESEPDADSRVLPGPGELGNRGREDEHVRGADNDLVLRYHCECPESLVYPFFLLLRFGAEHYLVVMQ